MGCSVLRRMLVRGAGYGALSTHAHACFEAQGLHVHVVRMVITDRGIGPSQFYSIDRSQLHIHIQARIRVAQNSHTWLLIKSTPTKSCILLLGDIAMNRPG